MPSERLGTRKLIFSLIGFALLVVSACGEEATVKQGNTCSGYSPTGAELFLDTAEDNDASDWTVVTYGVTPISPGANGSCHAFEIGDGAAVHNSGVYKTLGAISPTYLSYWVNTANTGIASGYLNLFDAASSYAVNSYILTGGFYRINGVNTFSVVADTWYFVEFKNINYSSNSLDLFVDGVAWSGNPIAFSSPVSEFSRMDLYNFGITTARWDEIVMLP